MEKLCIDVRGFSEEKKKRVEDAFSELGLKWPDGCTYLYLDANRYGNVYPGGDATDSLMWGSGDMSEQQRKYEITYPELMRKAGLDESDPDAIISTPTKKDLERDINRLSAHEVAEPPEQPATLQSTIHNYINLLNKTYDQKARELIENQLVDLMDFEYQQLTGESEND